MNFEDRIFIKGSIYSNGYVEFSGKFYMIDDEGNPDTSKEYEFPYNRYDEDGNPVVATDFCFMDYGKCIIFPNQRANSISLTDGSIYVYSYEVYVPLSKKKYSLIPREGDVVKIQKKDGTIDIEKEVKGFVTYKRKYLRLWL